MRIVICIIFLIILYRQLATVLNFSQSLINIPTQLASLLCGYFLILEFYKSLRNHRAARVQNNRPIRPLRPLNPFEGIDFEPFMIRIEQHIIRIPFEDRVDYAMEDNHNVHNKTVKRTAVMAINELKKSDRKIYSIESAITAISELIKSKPKDLSEDKLLTAQQSLDLIDEMDSLYYTANIAEREIIRLVWERINHPINSDKSDQLKENLIKELADCKKGTSSVHCCEGRVTRILQSLQSCDNENIVDLRPMWAFKEEIENKISQYRDKLLKKAPPKYAATDEKIDLNDEDRRLIDIFNQCLLKNLSKRFDIDYIKPGYLNSEELADLTKTYYESLYDY